MKSPLMLPIVLHHACVHLTVLESNIILYTTSVYNHMLNLLENGDFEIE